MKNSKSTLSFLLFSALLLLTSCNKESIRNSTVGYFTIELSDCSPIFRSGEETFEVTNADEFEFEGGMNNTYEIKYRVLEDYARFCQMGQGITLLKLNTL